MRAAALVLLASCASGDAEPATPDADAGGVAAAPEQACTVQRRSVDLPRELRETSGAALDPRDPDVFWSHGDSGAEPAVYAVSAEGRLAGRVAVTGAGVRDWEDLAIGPCPEGRCVYAGDIGSNTGRRNELVLYRAPLPSPADTATRPAQAFRARYPDEGRDAEALFVAADGGVYVINKGQRHTVDLWRWPTPLRPGPVDLVRVRTLAPEPRDPSEAVTGAGASEDGKWVAVRTYGRLSVYRTADLLGDGGPAFTMDLAPLAEPQGEAVSMRSDGTVLLTSEGRGRGVAGRATWLRCALPE